jgi:outer membrane protein assembly factor BamE (lipoprotein component of BamABCDE complex)
MKSKKTFLIAVLAVFVIISVSALSGCGFYNVQSGGTGHFITKKQFQSVKIGTKLSTILARFGKPTFTRRHKRVLYYCGNVSKNTSVLYVFNSKNTKRHCVIFRFRSLVKNDREQSPTLYSKKITG